MISSTCARSDPCHVAIHRPVLLVIEAMREPTADMNDAIVDVMPDRPHADYWRAGIDAALAEKTRWRGM